MSTNFYIGAAYVCSMLATAALTPVVAHIARRLGIVDLPGGRKVHETPTPRVGGLAIALVTLAVVIPLFLAISWTTNEIGGERARVAALLLCSTFLLMVGVVDDICTISASYKLVALLLAAVAFCSSGGVIHEFNVSGHHAISLHAMAWPVTILWLVAVTVSINFMDGLDGLAAGIVAIACGVLAIGAAVSWQVPVLLISLALLGSLSGFLIHNFNPAKVFMGDCGSMFIGFTLAACGVLYAQNGTKTGGLLLPVLALSIPFMDLLLTMVRRVVLHRSSMFAAERGHIHHRLLDIGLRHRHAVLILYIATAGSALVGLTSLFLNQWIFYVGLLLLIPALFSLFVTAGSVRGRETLSAVRRNRAISREVRANQRAFDDMQLRFRGVKDFGAWWDTVCAGAEALGLARIALPLQNRDGSPRVFAWCRPDLSLGPDHEPMKVTLPIRQRRSGASLRAEIEIAVYSTLESAGQRLAYFSRLMGEHSLADLENGASYAGRKEMAAASLRWRRKLRREQRTNGETTKTTEQTPKIAIVHDFLYTYAGAERVLEQMLQVFPDADLFALFDFLPPDQREFIRGKKVTTTFIQKLPFARSKHRAYLPLMPMAIEQLDVSGYDIVISSSYCVAKGVLTRGDQLHVCYCHTPMRFAWDLQQQYLAEGGLGKGLRSMLARMIFHYARTWDARSANGVDMFVTNSEFIGRRTRKVYRRPSQTIYPPVDVETFKPGSERSDYYVTASRMVPYKRIDLIVEAFTAMPDRRLIVIGDGPEIEKIRSIAGPNVKLVGHQPLEELVRYLQLAKAFVFAAEEDFGICVVEAQACGTPVIAYRRGGAAETVIPGVTGMFFDEQSVESIMDAVDDFEVAGDWDQSRVRRNAERFSIARFRAEFEILVRSQWEQFRKGTAAQRPGTEQEMALASVWNQPLGIELDNETDSSAALQT